MEGRKNFLIKILLLSLFAFVQAYPQSFDEQILREPRQGIADKAHSVNTAGKREITQSERLDNFYDETGLEDRGHVPKHIQILHRKDQLRNDLNKLKVRNRFTQKKSNIPHSTNNRSFANPQYRNQMSCDTAFASWIADYSGPIPSADYGNKVMRDNHGNVYVTGKSGEHCMTIKYDSLGKEQWSSMIDLYEVMDLHVDTSGYVYITGACFGANSDYATVKYNSSGDEQWIARYNGLANSSDFSSDLALDDSGNVYVTGVSNTSTYEEIATIKYNASGVRQWIARFAGPGHNYQGTAIAVDDSGNVYVAGTGEIELTNFNYVTIKYNPSGIEQWDVQYDGGYNLEDILTSMDIDVSGNIFVTGWSNNSTTHSDYATVKYNSSGIIQWVARYDLSGSSGEYAIDIALDRFGNAYVTGYSLGYGAIYGYTTVKYNSSGHEQWVARYNGITLDYGEPSNILTDYDGNVYVTGYSTGLGTSFDYATVKYDSSGDMQWVVRYNGTFNSDDKASTIFVDDSGNVYVTGSSIGDDTGYDFLTVKYNSSGVESWLARYDGPRKSKDYAEALAIDDSGNVYVTGSSANTSGNYDFSTVKYNSFGVRQWIARYDGPEDANDYASTLVVDIYGNVYVTGVSEGPGPYSDYTIVKYNTSGEEGWIRNYNGPGNAWDEATDIAVDDSGNVYVTGTSNGFATNDDFATLKYGALGNEQWIARFNGLANSVDHAVKLALDSLGNVYVTGYSQGLGTGIDYATAKYNHSGIEQWVVRYNGPVNYNDYANDLFIDQAGNVYVTGYSQGSGTGFDYATIKYNSSGDEQWIGRYNGTGNGYDEAKSVAVDVTGNVYVTGSSQVQETDYDYVTIKYNPVGLEQWNVKYDGTGNSGDYATALTTDIFGNVYVTGSSEGSGTDYDYATVMYNSSGMEQWVTRYNGLGNGYDEPTDITIDSLGNIYITGTTSSALNQYTTIKYDQEALGYAVSEKWNLVSLPKYVTNPSRTSIFPSSLTPLFEYDGVYLQRESLVVGKGYWTKFQSEECISIAGDNIIMDTIIVNEGWNLIGSLTEPILTNQITADPPGLITSEFFGYKNSYIQSAIISPGKGYWVKVDQPGQLILSSKTSGYIASRIKIVPTSELPPPPPGEDEELAALPKIYTLDEAYPNPFNPSTQITYSVPKVTDVTLKIYDVLGQEIALLVNERKQAGEYKVTWNAESVPSGVYFYRIVAGDFIETKKMIVIR